MSIKCVLQQGRRSFFFIALLVGLNLVPVTTARAASLTVNTLLDNTTNSDGLCTLREAITAAENNANYNDCTATGYGNDTITFGVSGTITLGSTLPYIYDPQGLTIDGVGQSVTISGNDKVRILWVHDVQAVLTLRNLTIAHGKAYISDIDGVAGGIINEGTLTVDTCTFSANSAEGYAGAIFNLQTLTITNSTFSLNGAIENGGAIYSFNTLVVAGSTFSFNSASNGGAIAHGSHNATITNCTFRGNLATSAGGGIFNDALGWFVLVTNSTFSGNRAADGVDVRNQVGTVILLHNTIVASSVTNGCSGTINNGGNNIDYGATCGWGSFNGSMSNTNPQLGVLANYGGATQTFPLLAGSPAIDGVTWNAPNACPTTDQRGFSRPVDGDRDGTAVCDIGAYEKWIDVYLPLVVRNYP